jgi:hypothetical protein
MQAITRVNAEAAAQGRRHLKGHQLIATSPTSVMVIGQQWAVRNALPRHDTAVNGRLSR